MTPTDAMTKAAQDGWVDAWAGNFDQRMRAALTAALAVSGYGEVVEALRDVRKLISAAAATGFNHNDGDWPERLYFSQQKTSVAIAKASGDQS